LAFAYSLWTIAGAGADVVFKGFMLLMIGVPVYVYMKWRDAREGRTVMPEAELPSPATPEAPVESAPREPVVV